MILQTAFAFASAVISIYYAIMAYENRFNYKTNDFNECMTVSMGAAFIFFFIVFMTVHV